MARLAGALADRYRIKCELGAGGMATVYLAEDLKHQREVAIKGLREDLAASMGSVRFLREIQIAAKLQHPCQGDQRSDRTRTCHDAWGSQLARRPTWRPSRQPPIRTSTIALIFMRSV